MDTSTGNIGSDVKVKAKTVVDKFTSEARTIHARLVDVEKRVNDTLQRLQGPVPTGEDSSKEAPPQGELGVLEEAIHDLGRITSHLEDHTSALERL